MATALRIVDEANVGFAPGIAFGAAGEGYLRMCYLKEEHKLTEGLNRFTNWLKNNHPSWSAAFLDCAMHNLSPQGGYEWTEHFLYIVIL